MKIGVVSDTHRNKETLDSIAEWLVHKQNIVTLYHLGDDYEDVVDLNDRGIEIIQVPGIYHPKYKDKTLPKRLNETVMGVQILLVHSIEKDINHDDKTIYDIILHGHTHKPEMQVEDGVLIMNPGHLKPRKDKNIDPSFGLLDISNHGVNATIFDLDKKPLFEVQLLISENGLYRS